MQVADAAGDERRDTAHAVEHFACEIDRGTSANARSKKDEPAARTR
jgi:hypothetical protein